MTFRFCPPFVHENINLFFRGHFFKSTPSSRCHEATVFKIHTSVHIQLGPMAVLSSWRQSLCKSAIRKFLEGAVNPSEA